MSAELYGSVGGVTRKAKKLYANVNGVTREIKSMYAKVNGVVRKVYSGAVYKWTYSITNDGSMLSHMSIRRGNSKGESAYLRCSSSYDDHYFELWVRVNYSFNDTVLPKGTKVMVRFTQPEGPTYATKYWDAYLNKHIITDNRNITYTIQSDTQLTSMQAYIDLDTQDSPVNAILVIRFVLPDGTEFILDSSGTSENQ